MQPNDQPTQPPEQQPVGAPSQPENNPSVGPYQEPVPYSDNVENQTEQLPGAEPIRWSAIEYIQHAKQPLWYIGFAVTIIVLMALAVLLIKSWTFAILIPVMAAALMVYSHRPPRELSYVLSDKGLFINDQLHPLGEFKAFGVVQDVELHALELIPTKRFRPGLTVYFPTEVGEALVDFLGARLPMQELHADMFDKIVRALRL